MKTVGIICEYNPFHLGHLRQIRLIKEHFGSDTAVVCVMSGHYVQRGLPAMWDKYTRAKAAVACGADLVLELPVTKVLQSAEGFARGGVEILSRLGCVDVLCFGAECGDGETLMSLAKKLDMPASAQALRRHLDAGMSYPSARQLAVEDKDDLLASPNNILGVEYCRAITHFGSSMEPFAVLRSGDYHAVRADSAEPSATAVRSLYPDGNWRDYVPKETYDLLSEAAWYDISFGERAVLARLRALSDSEWEHCAHSSEGLWSKAMKAARSADTLEQMIEQIKSKRYPRTRIQRLLLCAYLGLDSDSMELPISYTRLLAVSQQGRYLLRQLRKTSSLPIINPGEPPEDMVYYRFETRAADLFSLFSSSKLTACKTEQNARLQVD